MIEIAAIIGLHWILRYGSILNKPRNLIKRVPIINELMSCSLCLGFWCGFVVSIYTANDPLLYSFTGAASCWFADNLNNLIQRADLKLENDTDS